MSNSISPLSQKDGESKDLVAENIERLKQLFPEIVTDGKVDFEVLQEVLGEFKEESQERYSFTWNGKSKARKLAMTPSKGTLRPAPEESVNWDTTENLFIEGDNLEVLKLLQRSCHNKVKMIYIDPPYNTGNDFVYNDDFKDNLSNYLKLTGQKNGEGNKITSNPETNGRYHTDWLNMMYPRLLLAKELLREDGVIFISIDDNEHSNLVKLGNEVFGEENFVGTIPWRKRTAKSDVPFGVSQDYEWIVSFSKGDFLGGLEIERKYYKSEDYESRWRLSDITTQRSKEERPNSYFPMINPRDKKEYIPNPNRVWGVSKDTFQDYYDRGKIVFPGDYDFLNISIPSYRVFEKEDQEKNLEKYGLKQPLKAVSTHFLKDIGLTRDGTKEITKLFNAKVFPYPKPTVLLKKLFEIIPDDDFFVIDLFAGSGSLSHALFDYNNEHNKNIKFIATQLPEKVEEGTEAHSLGYNTIADIAKKRIKKVIKELKDSSSNPNDDLGFKVFKLDTSNIKPWDPTFNEIQLSLEDSIENVKLDRTEQDVLYEILLKYGLDLTLPIQEKEIAGANVFVAGAGALFICLAPNIDLAVVEGIAKLKEELKPELTRVVFRDSGFKNDVVKTNTVQILKQHGIEDVRSI